MTNYGDLYQATMLGYMTSLEHDLAMSEFSGELLCVEFGDEKYIAEALYAKATGWA